MSLPDLFLSCDWGTSRFRLRLVDFHSLSILAETANDSGVATLAAQSSRAERPNAYRQVLLSAIETLQQTTSHDLARWPVVVSGMASSSLGWHELPYAPLPFALSGASALWKVLEPLSSADDRPGLFLVSGVCSREDVMRGEETELLGAWQFGRARDLGPAALAILPGTHSKHIIIRHNEVVDFHTYMTGELFAALGQHTVLKHSLPTPPVADAPLPIPPSINSVEKLESAFREGVALGEERSLSNVLFLVRTRALLSGLSPDEASALLSGLLIGGELATLLTYPDGGMPILLAAGGELATRYQIALDVLAPVQRLIIVPPADYSELVVRGQAVLLREMLARKFRS